MPLRTITGALGSACAVVLVLSACGGGGGGSDKPKSSPAPAPKSTEHVISSAKAKAGLLKTKDVGSTLQPLSYRSPTHPLFCGSSTAPTVEKQTKATGVIGARFMSKDPKADVVEDVYLYKSAADARAALNMVQTDMDCATGHTYNSDGTSAVIGIGASIDYSAKLTAAFAYGWSLRTVDSRGIELAVPVGSVLMLFRYTAGTSANTDKLPDAFDLASTAFNRLAKA